MSLYSPLRTAFAQVRSLKRKGGVTGDEDRDDQETDDALFALEREEAAQRMGMPLPALNEKSQAIKEKLKDAQIDQVTSPTGYVAEKGNALPGWATKNKRKTARKRSSLGG